MLRTILTILLAAGVFLQTAHAEAPASLIEQFEGRWTSDGDAFGADAQSVMVWRPALNGKFVQLDYRIEMTRKPGEMSVFEGVAYYRMKDGDRVQAFWADNSGDLHPISAERDETALVSHWGVEGGKQGRTRYELLASGDMQVTDWIRTPEGWRQFNQNVFSKAPAE